MRVSASLLLLLLGVVAHGVRVVKKRVEASELKLEARIQKKTSSCLADGVVCQHSTKGLFQCHECCSHHRSLLFKNYEKGDEWEHRRCGRSVQEEDFWMGPCLPSGLLCNYECFNDDRAEGKLAADNFECDAILMDPEVSRSCMACCDGASYHAGSSNHRWSYLCNDWFVSDSERPEYVNPPSRFP